MPEHIQRRPTPHKLDEQTIGEPRSPPKQIGARTRLHRVKRPSRPSPMESASIEPNSEDRVGGTGTPGTPANAVELALQWTADRTEGIGARVQPA